MSCARRRIVELDDVFVERALYLDCRLQTAVALGGGVTSSPARKSILLSVAA